MQPYFYNLETMKVPRFLLEGHRSYLDNSHQELVELQQRLLTEGQSPEVLWFGCSDSRVMPETIVNSKPGDLFVVRNVGNVVPAYNSGGNSVAAAIEFSLASLGVKHAIVCGHEDCGAMKAIQKGGVDANTLPSLANWIRSTQHDIGTDPEIWADLTLLTRRNILLQIERLKTHPQVAKALEAGTLTLHAWYINIRMDNLETYDFETGEWCRLGDMHVD